MKKSRYFSELIRNYMDEVDDLVTDSEGKSVLQRRLNEKRREIEAILPMIELSPEMVSVIFYGAFRFKAPEFMQQLVLREPEDADFPAWAELSTDLGIADWATPLIESTLKAPGGEGFMVATAALEFLRNKDAFSTPQPEPETDKETGDEDEGDEGDDMNDLDEAGADWLAEQGFDPLDR